MAFKILAIDGGGIRGVVPAHIIQLMHARFGVIPAKHFDLIAGTSTGAIIAAALACEIEPSTILDLYKKHGARIFRKKWSLLPSWLGLDWAKALFQSSYTHDELSKLLKEVFGDKKLGEIKIPLVLPSTDIGNGCVHVFKSGYSDKFVRDPDVFVRDAVIASCSAPTFFDPYKMKEYLLADGGLWANNPALTATIEAIHRMNKDPKSLRVLSLGTGQEKTYYEQSPSFFGWGFLTRWKRKNFISLILSLQSQAAHNHLKLSCPGNPRTKWAEG
ncbi:MAG: patatin-like phospholipase family protein [Bdellovibrionales bacterium]|nr:patatin-like phospholipase family protein [Bdellovibrionales bacterium]